MAVETVYDDYEEDSWDAYDLVQSAITNNMAREDVCEYLPSPAQIHKRKHILLTMKLNGFNGDFIDWSFQHHFSDDLLEYSMRLLDLGYNTKQIETLTNEHALARKKRL